MNPAVVFSMMSSLPDWEARQIRDEFLNPFFTYWIPTRDELKLFQCKGKTVTREVLPSLESEFNQAKGFLSAWLDKVYGMDVMSRIKFKDYLEEELTGLSRTFYETTKNLDPETSTN